MEKSKKIKIAAIVGPTASGKSALALALAQRLGGVIISCDSMQVYRRMDIGTAKPTLYERALVEHRMTDVAEPSECFSCADYVRMAHHEIKEVSDSGRLPIICGGTGLYFDALLRGTEFEETSIDMDYRRTLEAYAREHGNDALHTRLAKIDIESAAAIHPNNVKRVIRAMEIFRTSGHTKSELDRRSLLAESKYDALTVYLDYAERNVLYTRIDERVDRMIADGLADETKALLGEGVFSSNATAGQAIGYKELLGYLAGTDTLADATEKIKTATRKYAKRQMTWFSAKPYITRLGISPDDTFENIVNNTLTLFINTGLCDRI